MGWESAGEAYASLGIREGGEIPETDESGECGSADYDPEVVVGGEVQ